MKGKDQLTGRKAARESVAASAFFVFLPLILALLPACIHSLSLRSMDGEILSGKYRFAQDDSGLIKVMGANGEVLTGPFDRVGRATFVGKFKKTFGPDSIVVYGPDESRYGNAFGGTFASSYAIIASAAGNAPSGASGDGGAVVVKGPLFYWTAPLRGDKGTSMQCYFIGSTYTGHGLGKCKNSMGKEYSVEF